MHLVYGAAPCVHEGTTQKLICGIFNYIQTISSLTFICFDTIEAIPMPKEVNILINQHSRVINMPLFSQTITDFWSAQFLKGEVLHSDVVFTVSINPDLSEDCRVMVLETSDGR